MNRAVFLTTAVLFAARSAAALTVSDSALITAVVPEFISVAVTGGPVALNFTPQGAVEAGSYEVSGGTVTVVHNGAQAGDVTVELRGASGNAPGVLDGPAQAPGFAHTVQVTEVALTGISAAPFPVNLAGGSTQADVLPPFSASPAVSTVRLNVGAGGAPLVSGAYAGNVTVTVTGS